MKSVFLFFAILLALPTSANATNSFFSQEDFFEKHSAIQLLIDPETGKILGANQRASDFYGYSIPELEQMNIGDINTFSQNMVQQEMENAKLQNRNFFIFRHQLKNGDIKTVNVYSAPVTYKGKKALHSIITANSFVSNVEDSVNYLIGKMEMEQNQSRYEYLLIGSIFAVLTIVILGILLIFLLLVVKRHKKLVHIHEDARKTLEHIVWGGRLGTWEWDVQTGKVAFNDKWANIIGYELEELEPVSIETWMKYAHPDDLQHSSELLQKTFNKELAFYECEARMKHKDGHWVWVLDRGRVIEWSDQGQPLLMAGTHIDITDFKNLQQKLDDQIKLKDKFFSILAHDLKNPFNYILGMLLCFYCFNY